MKLFMKIILVIIIATNVTLASSIITNTFLTPVPIPISVIPEIGVHANRTYAIVSVNACNRSRILFSPATYNSLHIECMNCIIETVSIVKHHDILKSFETINSQNFDVPLYNYCIANVSQIEVNIALKTTTPIYDIKVYYIRNVQKMDLLLNIMIVSIILIITTFIYLYYRKIK